MAGVRKATLPGGTKVSGPSAAVDKLAGAPKKVAEPKRAEKSGKSE